MNARCELCGSEHCSRLFKGQDWLYGLAVQSEVVRCDDCGLIYLWPQPVRPLDFYPYNYAPHVGQPKPASADVACSIGRRRGLLRKARLANQYQQRALLDIGCAAGEFIAVIRALDGWMLWGMDRSERAVRHARQYFGVDVWVGDVPGLPLPNRSIGVVTMWHVLEHLPQPLAALRDIARVLQPDGVLMLACPMVDSWEAWMFGRYWAGYDVPRHLFVYSRQTLQRMLRQAGFEASEIPNVVWGYNSAKISSAFWLRKFPAFRYSPFPLHRMAALMGASAAMVFWLLSHTFGNRGSVAVIVACKRLSAEE